MREGYESLTEMGLIQSAGKNETGNIDNTLKELCQRKKKKKNEGEMGQERLFCWFYLILFFKMREIKAYCGLVDIIQQKRKKLKL